MVTARLRATVSRIMGIQTEALCLHVGVQTPGCGGCQSLAFAMDCDRDNRCVRCEQVNDLLSLVGELKEAVARQRIIRECEEETDLWSRVLPSLMKRLQVRVAQEAGEPMSSCHLAKERFLMDGEEWKQAGKAEDAGEQPPHPSQPSQVAHTQQVQGS